jgi:hypothetical protein
MCWTLYRHEEKYAMPKNVFISQTSPSTADVLSSHTVIFPHNMVNYFMLFDIQTNKLWHWSQYVNTVLSYVMHLLQQQDVSELTDMWQWGTEENKMLTGTDARKWHRTYGHLHVLRSVIGRAGVRGNEILDKLARHGSALKFVGRELALGVSGQDIRRRIRRWLVNQHWICWQGLGDTQRQARELISGPCLGAKARFLSFNRTKSRSVTGLLTGRNTLRRRVHLTGLSDSPLCSRCGAEDETSAQFFVSVWLWLHLDVSIWAPVCSQRTLRV